MQDVATRVPAELQEKVLLGGDLARLTPAERLTYYNAVCTSVGLNPLTRPFEYLALNGKLVLYARKDCTDQLRDLHGISVQIVGREVVDGCYVVTAQGKNMTERTDESIGAVPLPTSAADKANAMMKAETKAKRRVTLSICGLGMLDETEIDTIQGAHPVPPPATVIEPTVKEVLQEMGEQDGAQATAQVFNDAPAKSDAAHPPKTFNQILMEIDGNADWNVLKMDWKNERKIKNLTTLTPDAQKLFLTYMREKIGTAFPY